MRFAKGRVERVERRKLVYQDPKPLPWDFPKMEIFKSDPLIPTSEKWGQIYLKSAPLLLYRP